MTNPYSFTNNPTVSGVATCDTDILNDDIMFLKWGLDNTSVSTLDAAGTVALSDNTIYKISPTGSVTFTLPTVTDLTTFHQIFIQINMSTATTINLGTTYYFNNTAPDLSTAGTYNLYFEYDNTTGHWVCGCLPKGAE